jgi:hypothetical protein
MSATRDLRWGVGLGAALLCGGLAAAGLAACSADDSTSAPTGKGDDITVDVDATSQQGGPMGGAGADSPFARVDGGAYDKPDGYDPYGICQKCACPATDYCFGGGGSFTQFDGNCKPAGFGIGCNPLPAGCSGGMDCECLLKATASEFSCYGVCVQNSTTVYCPNP